MEGITMKQKITKRLLDSLPAPEPGEQIVVRDTVLQGFTAVKYPTGTSFQVVYGGRGSRRKLTLGAHGQLTVDQARDLAKQKLGDVAHGIDPAEEREAQRAVPTLAAWVEDYLKDVAARKKSVVDDRRYLRWTVEKLPRKTLDAITVDDVQRLLEYRREHHGQISANRWYASLRTCLQAAWRANKVKENVAAKVRKGSENDPRTRVLSDAELARALDALDAIKDPFVRCAFDLIFATGVRKSEALRARWEHIDLDGGIWRLPSTKSGKPQVVPLPRDVAAMLKNMPRVGEWVVPGRFEGQHLKDLRNHWNDVRAAAQIPDVTIHDVRRTFGLRVAKIAGLHIASKLLRHSTVRITEQVYAPLGIEDLRKATEKAARGVAKVIKLERGRK